MLAKLKRQKGAKSAGKARRAREHENAHSTGLNRQGEKPPSGSEGRRRQKQRASTRAVPPLCAGS